MTQRRGLTCELSSYLWSGSTQEGVELWSQVVVYGSDDGGC